MKDTALSVLFIVFAVAASILMCRSINFDRNIAKEVQSIDDRIYEIKIELQDIRSELSIYKSGSFYLDMNEDGTVFRKSKEANISLKTLIERLLEEHNLDLQFVEGEKTEDSVEIVKIAKGIEWDVNDSVVHSPERIGE